MIHKRLSSMLQIILLLLSILPSSSSFPVEVFVVNNSDKKIEIYNQSEGQNAQFSQDTLQDCNCSPDSYKQIQYGKNEDNYILINNVGKHPIKLNSVKFYQNDVSDVHFSLEWSKNTTDVQNLGESLESQSRTIEPKQSLKIIQKIKFPSEFNEDNYWLTAHLDFVFSKSGDDDSNIHLNMYYIAVLDKNYKPKKFDWALILLITLACIMIYFFARFGQIYAYKTSYCGSSIRWWWGIIYSVILTIIVLLVHFLYDISVYVLDIVMIVLSLFCCYVFICEVIALLCFSCRSINTTRMRKPTQSFFFKTLFYKVRLVDIIGFIVSTACVAVWFFIQKPWFMNDILSIAIMSCSIKFFKITSMKSAALFMGITLLYDIIGGLLIHYSQDESYDSLILSQANYPFELQIPSFKHILNKKCAWIAVTAIILPGFFLQYLHRFDKSRNSSVYAILGFLGLFIGSILWVLVTIWNIHSWPFACFTYPLIYLFVTLFALKRSETNILWSGDFYDPELLTPLTLKLIQDEAEKEEQDDEQMIVEEMEEEPNDNVNAYFKQFQINRDNADSTFKGSLASEESEHVVYSKFNNVSHMRKTKLNYIDPSLFQGLAMQDNEENENNYKQENEDNHITTVVFNKQDDNEDDNSAHSSPHSS